VRLELVGGVRRQSPADVAALWREHVQAGELGEAEPRRLTQLGRGEIVRSAADSDRSRNPRYFRTKAV